MKYESNQKKIIPDIGFFNALRWRHNGHNGVSNHQPRDCLLNRLFERISKKTSKLRVTGLCAGNSPMTGEFPAQRASNAENVSIWWCHHGWMEAILFKPQYTEQCGVILTLVTCNGKTSYLRYKGHSSYKFRERFGCDLFINGDATDKIDIDFPFMAIVTTYCMAVKSNPVRSI